MLGLRDSTEPAGATTTVGMVEGGPAQHFCATCGRRVCCTACDPEVRSTSEVARAAAAGFGSTPGQQSYGSSSGAMQAPWIGTVQVHTMNLQMAGRTRAPATEGGAQVAGQQSMPSKAMASRMSCPVTGRPIGSKDNAETVCFRTTSTTTRMSSQEEEPLENPGPR
jgi:hypothetical protein